MSQLIVLLIGSFIFLCIAFVLSRYDFFSPSFVICALFFISTLFAIYAVGSWGVSKSFFTYEASFIILSGIVVFIIGELFARSVVPRRKRVHLNSLLIEKSKAQLIRVPRWKMIFMLVICASSMTLYVYYLYRYVRANGYTGGFSSARISSFYHRMTFKDITVGGIPRFVKLLSELTNATMYVCIFIFLNNIILCRDKIIKNIGFLIPALCWIPRVLYTSSRTNYVRLVGFTILVAYIMMNRRANWQKKKRNFKKILKVSIISLTIVFLLFYLAVANGFIGRQTDKTLVDYIAVYVGAPIIHFNQFIIDPPSDVQYFGQETFAGLNSIFMRMGLRDTSYSVQLEVRNIIGIYNGNVYTFFRRPLHDFGLFGMYVITFLTGFVYSYVYYKKIYLSKSSFRTDRTIIIYGYLFYVIYMFSIMNNYCNFISISLLYFLVSVWLSYTFLVGNINIIVTHTRRVKYKKIPQ